MLYFNINDTNIRSQLGSSFRQLSWLHYGC